MALTPSALSLPKGTLGTLSVTIAPTQPEAAVVPLASSDPLSVEVPASVTIPAGASTAAFPVLARSEGSATVTAGPLNGTSQQATVTVTPPALVTLLVTPPAPTIAQGQTQPFTAEGTYTDATTRDLTGEATWASSDETVATITASGGLATGVAPGTSTITATVTDTATVTASATLTVTPPILASLAISPSTPSVLLGQTVQLSAVGTLTDGTTQDVTAQVTWTSSDSAVATIAATGLATALTPGTTTVTATHPEGLTASTTLTVVLPPPTLTGFSPSAGPVGTLVSITGTNLQTTTQVTFNGISAAFTIQSPSQLTATVPAGTTTGPIMVTTPSGSVASLGSFTVLIPPTIAITEPADGATISSDRVLVRGTVGAGGAEVGVVVNGVPAALQGTTFAAFVAVTPDITSLTAVATTLSGATATSSVGVSVIPSAPLPITLEVFPTGGSPPLRVTFRVQNNTGRPLVFFELDFDGDGRVDLTSGVFDEAPATYPNQGLFLAKLRAMDDQGQGYTAETLVSVGAAPPLEPKWEGMKDALRRGNLPAALSFIHSTTRARYEATFQRLTPAQLANIDQALTTIVPVEIGPNGAEYEMIRIRHGQPLGFSVWFQVDSDGIWRLRMF